MTVPPTSGSAEVGASATIPRSAGSATTGTPVAPPKLTVRLTTPADLPLVTTLLSERDGHLLDPAHVSTALYGLDPALLAGWIAVVEGRPAGLTTLYVRDQEWGGRTIRAGYWSHLFVPEEFRRLMIYPQLVLAMMRGIKPLGIDCIFTGTRRPHVAEGHIKLGFARLGELGVLFKPLRPFRLIARYRKLPAALGAAAAPGDALYGAWLAARRWRPRDVVLRDADPSGPALDRLASVLNTAAAGRIHQPWTSKTLHQRFAGAIDGHRYHILLAERDSHTVGAAVYRIAERQGVSTGIIMELVTTPAEDAAAAVLLAETERRLRAAGADTTLSLDGLGPGMRSLLTSAGHRVSSETYTMLVWPKTLVPAGSPAADLSNWRFSFLDHDAF
jgi:hypothetical protein